MPWKPFETGPGDENEIDAEDDFQRVDPTANYLLPHSRLQIAPIGGDVAPAGGFEPGFGAAARGATSSAPSRARGLVGLLKQLIEEPPRTGAPRTPSNAAPSMRSNIAPSWDPTRPFAVQAGPPPQLRSLGENVGLRSQALGVPSSAHSDPNFRPSPSWDTSKPSSSRQLRSPGGSLGTPSPALGLSASAHNDPNFRQLSRMPSVQPQGTNASGQDSTSSRVAGRLAGSSNAVTPLPQYSTQDVLDWWAGRRKNSSKVSQAQLNSTFTGQGEGGTSDDGSGDEWDRKNPDFDIYRRCVRAADRDTQAWQDFCDDLPDDRKTRDGRQNLKSVCGHKLFESQPHKNAWCYNEFGLD